MMTSRRNHRYSVVALLVFIAAGLQLSRLWAGPATTASLGGDARYLTHISTDKPIYRAGETVYVRGTVLHADKHTPLARNARLNAMIEIQGPKGDTVASGMSPAQDSVLGFTWTVPDGQAGGEYTVRISYPGDGHPPAERTFDIRAYRAPRLKSQIVFLRDGYGPGDTVGASLHVERAEGGIPEGAKVTAIARVDGAEVYNGPAVIDAHGNCTVRFDLPAEIARGEGTLALVIEDGGIVETATKTIPILLQTVDLATYPEGGELVAGLPARVYLEARTPAAKPADIAGIVVDGSGREVATFRTEHEGRGRFCFTPIEGEHYTLEITEPSGINTTYPLGEVRTSGAVLRAVDERIDKGDPVRLNVASTSAGSLTVTLAQREIEVAATKIEVDAGKLVDVTLTPPQNVDGVLIATVWDAEGKPLAERLVYRQPTHSIGIDIAANESSYVPGQSVELTITTTDANGSPTSAVVGLTVTDDSVLEMIEKREQRPRLPVMVLLENDVRELADAHVYLDETNPKAPRAVDLLLGTQGWRRFAFVDVARFLTDQGDAALRVLALRRVVPRSSALGFDHLIRRDKFALDVLAAAPNAPPHGKALPVRKLAEKGVADENEPADDKNARAGKPIGQQGKRFLRRERFREADEDRIIAGALVALELEAPRLNDFVAVRVYAHAARPDRRPGNRVDFTETLYWNTGVRTDAKTGRATVTFALNDSVTAFRVFADGFAENGALGEATTTLESVEPFYLEPKLPLEVTTGDVVRLPLGVVSGLGTDLSDVTITADVSPEIRVAGLEPFTLAAGARVRRLIDLHIGSGNGPVTLVFAAGAGPYSDKVTRSLVIQPLGFPIERAFGGMLDANATVSHEVVIPADAVASSVTTNIAIYPTPLANLTEALERLIREPHGCFEQTSSTTYPLVMAQQYFQSHTGVDPALIERSARQLDAGYAKLIGFECKNKGYEWFAGDPGHEALTAYGLLEFTDMSRVRQVDREMLGRTRAWLLGTRDGKGGFSRKRRALHTWITDPDCSNAYITWALLESGEKDLTAEITQVQRAATESDNSYVVALAANVLTRAGEKTLARTLMEKLVRKQNADGWVDGATTSIVGSGGEALKIETTSLAVLAWLSDPSFTGAVERGVKFLAESCKAGRFGSTQSTVLALRALVAYDASRARPKADGSVRVFVDGQPVGENVNFDAKTQGAIRLPDISELLEPGRHTIALEMTNGSPMPFSLAVDYHSTTPASSDQCDVALKVALAHREITEGAVTEANVVVINRSDKAIPTPVAVVGLPGGLEPRHDQLKELVKAGTIDAYEVLGRQVVLYWREMKAAQKIAVSLSLVAAVPGTYTAPASRAYLYYTDEFKHWLPGSKITITPKVGG